MSKTSIRKNSILLGGLFFVTQIAIVPAASASAYDFSVQPTYASATSSAEPIVFAHSTDTDAQAITVAEESTASFSLSRVIARFDFTNTISKVMDSVDNSTATVNDNVEPTLDDIKAYVYNEAKKAGISQAEVATIINCESKWDPSAKGYNRNGSYDLGLWQINSIHKTLSDAEKLDYRAATKWALAKRLNEGNWSAWSCSRKLAKA